jgi:hypothetical protein
MTAVTVVSRKEVTGNMCFEVISGTFTNGYTYSSKYGTIVSVFIQSRSRAGAYASVSGSTITLNCASASGDTFDMLVIGY